MNNELIIKSQQGIVDIALLEDKLLVEIHREQRGAEEFLVGNFYLGVVKKLLPGLNAVFVDIGSDKDAFLHYLDLGPRIADNLKLAEIAVNPAQAHRHSADISKWELLPESGKEQSITSILKQGQQLLVQITKEAISSKGPRLEAELSLAGRLVVLLPFNNKISVSGKIKTFEEKKRLAYIVKSVIPNNFGVVVRTAAEGKSVAEIDNELNSLLAKWYQMVEKQFPKAKAPKLLLTEEDKTITVIRDMLNSDFNSIITDDEAIYREVQNYLKVIAPEKQNIVKLYKGEGNIFDVYNVTRQIKSSFGKVVPVQRSGVYLVIEHTEAMHVIDVNSGHKLDAGLSQEENALQTNLVAAQEIVRQLRLRDIGGIIVVDFVDMREGKNRRTLYVKMHELMSKDKTKHSILPPNKFGLIEITRQRTKPQTNIEVLEKCPICDGTGKVKSNILVLDDIEQHLEYLMAHHHRKVVLEVNPFIYSYLKLGFWSMQKKWWWKYKKRIKIHQNQAFHYLQYKFFDEKGEIKEN
ncbi:MAG: Rne/Rng family ribonuclease [Bacteroidales bacterium]|nr:Rne/Rng family ribonuclease [Bacteroidales bacterium]